MCRVIAPERILIPVLVDVTAPEENRLVFPVFILFVIIELFEVDEVSFPFVVIVENPPKRGESLLAVEQVFEHTTVMLRCRRQEPGDKLLVVDVHFEN